MAITPLTHKSILVTPMPFAEESHGSLGVSNQFVDPNAASSPTFSAQEKAAADFAALQTEAARLKAKTGFDWAVGNAVCDACGTTFGAVAPAGQSMFECPACHTHRARWKFSFVKPGRHWACVCGNMLFRASEQGWYCPQCGTDQDLPAFVKA